MKPIYTLTVNPALDVSGNVDYLLPNEKNYVHNERRDPGGNGINCARIIHRMGGQAVTLGFLGGTAGAEIAGLLKKEGIKQSFTSIHQNTRTNITVTNLDPIKKKHEQTRLTFPGPQVSAPEVSMLYKRISSLKGPSILVIGGSLPQGCPRTFFSKIARIAKKNHLGLIIDVPSMVLQPLLKDPKIRPILIKPNLHELEELFGKTLSNHKKIIEAARTLIPRCAIVVISLGSKGALLVTQNFALLGTAPRVNAQGTVGAGDSMVGAMTLSLSRQGFTSVEVLGAALKNSPKKTLATLSQTLKFGLAAGAATAMASGTGLARPEIIDRLFSKTKVRLLP